MRVSQAGEPRNPTIKPDFSFTETIPMVEGAKGRGWCALRFFKKMHFPRARKDKSPQMTRRTAREVEPLGAPTDLMGDAETVVRNNAEHKSPLYIIIDRVRVGWWEPSCTLPALMTTRSSPNGRCSLETTKDPLLEDYIEEAFVSVFALLDPRHKAILPDTSRHLQMRSTQMNFPSTNKMVAHPMTQELQYRPPLPTREFERWRLCLISHR